MASVTLAEALLRRKELSARLERIEHVKDSDVFKMRVRRVSAAEGIDEVTAAVPKLALAQVMAEFNHCAQQLRKVDAVIQQTNWNTHVDVGDCMVDYLPPEQPDASK